MQTRRLAILESSLRGREKVLVWLKKAQSRGSFYDHCRSNDVPLLLENRETAFLFHLVNQCNVQVLELTGSNAIPILGLYLLRLTLTDTVRAHEAELRGLRPILLKFATQGRALEGAIQDVCRDHAAGHQILFSDIQRELSAAIQRRQQLLEAYDEIAPKLGLDRINETDLESAVSEETERAMDELTRLCSAKAAVDFDCRHEARELLLPLIEPRCGAID